MRVAIQGYKGSYHEQVASSTIAELDLIECDTFPQVYTAVEHGQAALGIIAIENSIAGAILENYDRQRNSQTSVNGEYYLPIHHCLLVNEGVDLDQISEVWSHPMALKQCQNYLTNYPWKQIESEDTALSAKQLRENQSENVAVIASQRAAELYDLQIAAANIETDPHNFTRFWLIAKEVASLDALNLQTGAGYKTSIYMQTKHEAGGLLEALQVFRDYKLNMTMLVSRPIVGQPWRYGFYVDFTHTHKDLAVFLDKLGEHTDLIEILGSYRPHSQ